MMTEDPPSLPSTSQPTTVHITSTSTEMVPPKISVPTDLPKVSNSSPSSPQSGSASASGSGGQHTFYKPRATSTASARRSRAESLTNSLNNLGGAPGSNYPPSSTTTTSRPHSFSRSRPPSATYTTPAVPTAASLTHTGGILPPASFFHPKQAQEFRPPPLNANNVYAPPRASAWNGFANTRSGNTRPSSGISSTSSSGGGTMNPNFPLVSSTSSHAREHGLIMLPLSHIHSTHSDGSNSGLDISSYSDSSQRRRSTHGHSTRVKPSREALLPIGEKDTFSGNGSGKSQHTGVRGSIEKIFRRTTSSERERNETALISKEAGANRPVMDDHARAASSLSVRLRRANSTAEVPTRPEVIASPDPVSTSLQQPAVLITDLSHDEVPAHPFEGVALDGQRFTYGPERNWQNFPSQNTFFFNGRLLTGGDSPLAFIFSVSVLLAIAGVWFGTTAVWWWKHESPAVAAVGVYMCLLTISSMFVTAMRDPGILPRGLDVDPPYPDTPPADGSQRIPLPRDLRVRSGAVRVKYCTTCKIYRPPRSSHCKLCDNCVEGCDHHCPWVNNCIGRRNYTPFFTMLFFANATLILVIITSALHIWLLVHRHIVPNFADALKHAQGSAAAFVMSILVLGPVAALFSYHVRLMLLNITTIEQVRNQAHRSIMPGPLPANPFTLNKWYRNLGHLMCRPVIYSYTEPHALVKHDQRLPNPGHDRTARLASEGYDSEAFDHHHSQPTDSHRNSMWKAEEDLTELEMQHVAHGRVSNANRSTWDNS